MSGDPGDVDDDPNEPEAEAAAAPANRRYMYHMPSTFPSPLLYSAEGGWAALDLQIAAMVDSLR